MTVDGVYTNKAPGDVAYRCSFRVTEASYFIERMIDVLARKLDMNPAEIRRRNLIGKEQFPYQSTLGWEYDSGDYLTPLDKALNTVDYAAFAKRFPRSDCGQLPCYTAPIISAAVRPNLSHEDGCENG